MVKFWRLWLRWMIFLVSFFLLLSLNSCDEGKSPSFPEPDKPLTPSEMIIDPGNLAGTIVGTIFF